MEEKLTAKQRANKKYYEKNKKELYELNREWRIANREKWNEIVKRYYHKNKEAILAKRRENSKKAG